MAWQNESLSETGNDHDGVDGVPHVSGRVGNVLQDLMHHVVEDDLGLVEHGLAGEEELRGDRHKRGQNAHGQAVDDERDRLQVEEAQQPVDDARAVVEELLDDAIDLEHLFDQAHNEQMNGRLEVHLELFRNHAFLLGFKHWFQAFISF